MKITKISNNTLKVEIGNDEYIIDLSACLVVQSRFINFFRQLASALEMDMYSPEFIEIFDGEIVKSVYELVNKKPEYAKLNDIFKWAESSWHSDGVTENIIRGQRVRGILEKDYYFMQELKNQMEKSAGDNFLKNENNF